MLGGIAQATTLGINLDPAGSAWDRGDTGSGYAQWDNFSAFTFANDLPGSSSGITSAALTQSGSMTQTGQGAGLYNVLQSVPAASNGDVIFAGGNALNFSITGSTGFAIKGITLQIKRAISQGGFAANFTPTISINGGGAIAFNYAVTTTGSGDTSSDGGLWSVTTFYWDASLVSNADVGNFTVSFPSTVMSRGVDTIALDVGSVAPQAVPEPATWVTLGIGLGFVLLVSRRRFVRG